VTDLAEPIAEDSEPVVEGTELQAELIAYQLESALEVERQRRREAAERDCLLPR
jgi:hypothetical protein